MFLNPMEMEVAERLEVSLREIARMLHRSKAKGGRARAAALSPERRREIAQQAARTRWKGQNDG